MTERERKFAVPYNLTEPTAFLEELEPYKKNIDSIYFGIPSIGGYHDHRMLKAEPDFENVLKQEQNAYKFMKESKGRYKRFLTVNPSYFHMDFMDKKMFAQTKLIPIVQKYLLEGIILSDYDLIKIMHEAFPSLEISTSCNSFIWSTTQMDYYAQAGATIFNPPRDAIKIPELLKKYRETGYKLKYLINESCIHGCPTCITHTLDKGNRIYTKRPCGSFSPIEQVLKGNAILPRWLKYLDEYVDVYKISSRLNSTEFIIRTLDAYVNEIDDDSINVEDIVCGGSIPMSDTRIKFKDIPDKLLTCRCQGCETCGLCDPVIEKYKYTKEELKEYTKERDNGGKK